ncbi:hypothetical protein SAMN05444159_3575 [Bradyrhizobium lablabi]|uniref:Uncharacterized protein n=2 Tax=Bradyrhizobium lablabi TaxID=722472 RepID=A0A1M6TFX7_9BRAD|nr:hypothetical protein SAMN05444159_3575 [Bradyrhizobium lablabi]
MSMVGFPLLLIPLAIYNIIVFLMPSVSLADPVLKLTLMSGTEWPVTLSDMLLALGIVLLLFEIIKGARPGAKFLTDHLLSLIIFGAAAAEFVLWPRFGTSTYFLLALLAMADFLSGITLRARRGMAPAVSGRAARVPMEAPEPQFEPVPKPSAPVAAPAPAPAPVEPIQPKVTPADAASAAPSPVVASPELQPGNGAPSAPDTPPR